jgi:hypothetical protein
MANTRKSKKVKSYSANKELADVNRLFRTIQNDKTLPTFLSFFLECLVMGTSENVNLKLMYPKVHHKLSKWLKTYEAKIMKSRM